MVMEIDLDSRTSFHLGLIGEIMVAENFSVQPEVFYSAQGAKSDDVTLQLDYVSVPIMAKYFVAEGLSLEAGPQVAFNVKAQWEMDGETEDIDDVESVNFGAGLGLGYQLPQGIFFQARYNLGFSEIVQDSDMKNNVMQLSVGYFFNVV